MGLFSGESDQQRLVREMNEQLEQQKRKQQQAQEEFARTPRGRAQAAYAREDAHLRIELTVWKSAQERGFFGSVEEHVDTVTDEHGYAAAIRDVEAEGWQLVSASSAYVVDSIETGSSGGTAAVSGHMVDVLLFRRAQRPDRGPSTNLPGSYS